MKKPKFRFEIHKSKKNGEFFVKPVSKNGKEVFKETYKKKPKKTLISFLKAIGEGDYEILDCTLKCLLIVLIELFLRNFSSGTGVQLAWLPLAIGAGVGLANAFFGGSDRKTYTKADYEKYGLKDFDPSKAKGDLARLTSARLKGRRAGISAQNQMSGLNNPTDIYSNEEDLVNAQIQGNINIDQQDRAEENQIAMNLFQANESQPQDQNFFGKFLEGGLIGANLGYKGQELADKILPTDDTETTGTEVAGTNNFNTPGKMNYDNSGINSPQFDEFNSFLAGMPEANKQEYLRKLKGNQPFFDFLGSNNFRR